MYRTKEKPEDFYVREEMKLKLNPQGKYTYLLLRKRNWNTLDAVREVARKLRVNIENFNVAGNKDRRAVTEQYVSVLGSARNVEHLKIKDIDVKMVGRGDERISLGGLEGNHFIIVVRNLYKAWIRDIRYVPNYFDEQRFGGGLRFNNADVGRHLVKKEYKEAMNCYLGGAYRREMKAEREARRWIDTHWVDWEGALKKFPAHLTHERKVLEYLSEHPRDYVGAFASLNKKLLMLFVHAYQGLIWNEVLSKYIRNLGGGSYSVNYCLGKMLFPEGESYCGVEVPVYGFLTKFEDKEIEKIYSRILLKEKLRREDFVNRQIPCLSSEGFMRKGFVEIKDLKYVFSNDELHYGKKKCVLEFSLGKGSYGSVVVKALFG